jgi:hypothetical protein
MEYYEIVEVEIPVFNRLVRVMEVDLIEVD